MPSPQHASQHRRLLLATAVLFSVFAACRDVPPRARPVVEGGDPARGQQLLASRGCNTCHVIPGVAASTSGVGLSLANFGDRPFVAGRLRNVPENLVLWIREPQRVRPGSAMPDLGVTDTDARHMAAYLYTLSFDRAAPMAAQDSVRSSR